MVARLRRYDSLFEQSLNIMNLLLKWELRSKRDQHVSRGCRKTGVPLGHTTDSTFRRYAIVSEDNIVGAGRKIGAKPIAVLNSNRVQVRFRAIC